MPHFFFFLLMRFARTAPSGAPAGVTDVDVSVSRRGNLAGGPFPAVITECLEFSVTHNYTSPSVRGYFGGDIRSIFSLVEKKRLGRQTLRVERIHGFGGSTPRTVI